MPGEDRRLDIDVVEAGELSKEAVSEIVDSLATLLIARWEEIQRPRKSAHPKENANA